MADTGLAEKRRGKSMRIFKKYAVTLALLLLSLVCLVWMVCSSTQSVLSKPMQLHFTGEYSPDGENWQMIDIWSFTIRLSLLGEKSLFRQMVP